MRKKTRLVHGVGVNDADYSVQPRINGKNVVCRYYRVWANMLARCYDQKTQARQPTYIGCSVVPEWYSFMAFRGWMSKQQWEGMHLDKDLLFYGNKVYSPSTCVFVDSQLNRFVNENAAARGMFPVGVCWYKTNGKFVAHCNSPVTRKPEHLGYFSCPDAAHEAWRARKHEHALNLAAQQTDPRIAKALSIRYLPENIYKIV